ncbi:MAG: hypothetical protein ACPGVA_07420, partial [Pikeienuella sp.]
HFSGNIRKRVIAANGVATLIKLKGDKLDGAFQEKRDNVRRLLAQLEIRVTYSDIYGNSRGTKTKGLEWFGRHFAEYDMGARRLRRATE